AGLLDVVVVAALALAVLAEHVELVGQRGAGEEVARLRVAGDHPQRLPLSATADEDRRMRPGQRLRGVQRALELVVPAVERAFVVAPHAQADLQRLLQALEPLGQWGKRNAQAAGLLPVPGRA